MQVVFEVKDPKVIAAIVASLSGTAPKRGPGRPPKAVAEPDTDDESDAAADDDTDVDDESDAADDDTDVDDESDAVDDDSDVDDEEPKKAAKGPSLGDVIKLFSKNREAGAKALKKFKVKTVRELKAAQYPAFIKLLKAA